MDNKNHKTARLKDTFQDGDSKHRVIEKGNLINRLKCQLAELQELIRGLEADGPKRPFKKKEKALIRNVYLSLVQELATELPIFFMLDDQEAFENCQEALHGWMREIRDL